MSKHSLKHRKGNLYNYLFINLFIYFSGKCRLLNLHLTIDIFD